ncbi:biliverdin-producing heme oxygenase [Pseudomonas phytophila]|uniref:Biliverdin-producing heme oxygenase n=1 Tax=Pseudomonas phytophila TaxID=2867264 RepID=A0ABY6FIZ6_9PSED|nr:biliverdin-producing heme oxygenase [Pseudomonas phytophila]UXZ97888.1 biliverdin-producing heme oxygenase [Pseudomonas phytophila]
MLVDSPVTPDLPLSKRLKAGSARDHDSVDTLVMQSRPFADNQRYGCFLRLQHRFHGAIHELYHDAELNQLLPGLRELPRFDAVRADMNDIGLPTPIAPAVVKPHSIHAALGWLYCAEGSNLGAAFLFKETQQMGFGAEHGARHLAAHPDGRALHWREFVTLLDGLKLDETQKAQAIQGAIDAFDFYRSALRECFHS